MDYLTSYLLLWPQTYPNHLEIIKTIHLKVGSGSSFKKKISKKMNERGRGNQENEDVKIFKSVHILIQLLPITLRLSETTKPYLEEI